MNVETVILNNVEYYLMEKITVNNSLYYLLINTTNEKDFCIRKIMVENNIEYLVGLESEEEFNKVLEANLNNYNNKKAKAFFPIGTIVKLQDYDKKVMIVGYMMGIENTVFDYCGCDYPTGTLNKKDFLYFNKDNITKIVKLGYIDEETKKVLNKIELAATSKF